MLNRSGPNDASSKDLELTQHGQLNLRSMLEMMQPGVLDPATVIGRRVRWSYASTRSASADTKRVSDELKQFHLHLGATEVIVFRGPWLPET